MDCCRLSFGRGLAFRGRYRLDLDVGPLKTLPAVQQRRVWNSVRLSGTTGASEPSGIGVLLEGNMFGNYLALLRPCAPKEPLFLFATGGRGRGIYCTRASEALHGDFRVTKTRSNLPVSRAATGHLRCR
jgi:hypothetical protein